MDAIARPVARSSQPVPFTPEQVKELLSAARRGSHPERDEALLLLLLDTGLRVSEIAGLTTADIDFVRGACTVLGKGNKRRQVYFGQATGKALTKYLLRFRRDDGQTLFQLPGQAQQVVRFSINRMLSALGKAAKLEAVRCSPHTFRHTFAVSFLRHGGNTLALQQLMGHTDVRQTQKYVMLAQADIERQHRQFSPVDNL